MSCRATGTGTIRLFTLSLWLARVELQGLRSSGSYIKRLRRDYWFPSSFIKHLSSGSLFLPAIKIAARDSKVYQSSLIKLHSWWDGRDALSAVCFRGSAKGRGVQPPCCQGPHSQHRPATTVWLCHQAQCSWCVHPKETGSSRFTSAAIYISEALGLFTARTPGQFTHLRSAPGHALYQAPLRCEQRAGCRPKGTSSGDSSPFLIDTTSSIASISLLLHGMARL